MDFNWCGNDGESRYPVVLNDTGAINWHPDGKRGGIMRKEHDRHMLLKLLPLEGISQM